MAQGYTVWAYSPSTNQEYRQLNLANLAPIQEQATAQRDADSFAHIHNRDRKLGATDWVGVVKFEQVGIQTLPGYIGHQGQ